MKLRFFSQGFVLFIAMGVMRAGLLGADPVADGACYLSAQSEYGTAIFGDFIPFRDRFVQTGQGRIYDRSLKLTWIELLDNDNPGTMMRMDWGAAHGLAGRLKARLPELKELKTLITKTSALKTREFIEKQYFPLSSHTGRCWVSDSAGLWEPYHRAYVDFTQPAWGTTSMSEIYCVILISTD